MNETKAIINKPTVPTSFALVSPVIGFVKHKAIVKAFAVIKSKIKK